MFLEHSALLSEGGYVSSCVKRSCFGCGSCRGRGIDFRADLLEEGDHLEGALIGVILNLHVAEANCIKAYAATLLELIGALFIVIDQLILARGDPVLIADIATLLTSNSGRNPI